MQYGRILVVTDNPISRALDELATTIGRRLTVIAEITALEDLGYAQLAHDDVVVLCDHDHPEPTRCCARH